jgi:hypothetical protein
VGVSMVLFRACPAHEDWGGLPKVIACLIADSFSLGKLM